VSVTVESEFAGHARRYARLDWALIRTTGKRPYSKGWEHTTAGEPDFVAGQWNQWGKRFNMGCVLGPSGVAVFEYDDPDAQPLFLELLGGEIPETPICQTGSGKYHAYFADPGDLAKQTRDGLELRVGGHQCLVPPSIHPETGLPYTWVEGHEPWTLPLLRVPPRLLEFFRAEKRRSSRAAPLADVIPIGAIDTTLTSLAGTMRWRGMSEEAIAAALVAELARCEPGHTHSAADCGRIARSVSSYPASPAVSPPPLVVSEPETFSLERFPGLSLEQVLAMPPPEVRCLVDELIEIGALGEIAALPERYKSWLALELARKVAAQEGQLLGQDVLHGGAVSYWWQDDSERAYLKRLHAYFARHPRPRGRLRFHFNEGLTLPAGIPVLIEEIERHQLVLLVVDSVYKFLPGLDLKDEAVSHVYAELKARVCDQTGCTIAVLDHTPWPTENTRGVARSYGSVFKRATVRWGIYLSKRGSSLLVEAVGNNVKGLSKHVAVFDEDALELRVVEKKTGAENAEKIRELRAADPNITQKAVAKALGITERTVRKYWQLEEDEATLSLLDEEGE
jgi:putative DNA primase/helicase